MIEAIFLGTSSMFPTKERAHSCIYLRCHGENILFDCGEGAQRQMRLAKLSPMAIDRIFISHWHGDHALGLAGLVQSMGAGRRKKDLEIYGPKGSKKFIKHILSSFVFEHEFKIKVIEVALNKRAKKIYDGQKLYVESFGLEHSTPCCGYSLVEKSIRKLRIDYLKSETGLKQDVRFGKLQQGKNITINGKKISASKATFLTPEKRVSYIPDTQYFKGLASCVKGADILISESTFCQEFMDKSEGYYHMTAKNAAEVAKMAGVKRLVLTHFSQRYTDVTVYLKEAQAIFPDVAAAKDFDRFEVK